MGRIILIISCFSILSLAKAQDAKYLQEIKVWQQELNEEYLDPDHSPLSDADRGVFKGHTFYPIQEKYRVAARFEPTPDSKPFPLATSKGTTKVYKRIGILHFQLDGEDYTLEAYVQQMRFTDRKSVV